jgi:hypothetical protein
MSEFFHQNTRFTIIFNTEFNLATQTLAAVASISTFLLTLSTPILVPISPPKYPMTSRRTNRLEESILDYYLAEDNNTGLSPNQKYVP